MKKGKTTMTQMARRTVLCALLGVSVALGGCGKQQQEATSDEVVDLTISSPVIEVVEDNTEQTQEAESAPEPEPVEEDPEGMVRSDLTNEWIDEALANQRPIAVMVDNEKTALPHYGVSQADIVYEIMNSTLNNRITRFMVVVKDWESITQLGSVRSARPTNFMIAAEYNAILCHDGGPFYINDFVNRNYTNNLSGGFARFSNGKSLEFTEYITYDDYFNPDKNQTYSGLGKRLENAGYATEYNSYYIGPHFAFYDKERMLSEDFDDVQQAVDISLPFPHNSSKLHYNSETGTYDYSEYGEAHLDPGNGNAQLTFENVILQSCSFTQLDAGGYLVYNVIDAGADTKGYLIQNGEAVPITWSKIGENGITYYFYKSNGNIISLNTGKTYIALVPEDKWSELRID